MPQFKITFLREYKEFGEVIIEAEDYAEANDIAVDMESGGDDGSIDWGEMQQEAGYVESVEEI